MKRFLEALGVRHVLYGAYFHAGGFRWQGRRDSAAGRRITIVTFHRVDDRDAADPYSLPTLFISRERFRHVLEFLEAHYRIIALEDLLEALAGTREIAVPSCLLTFDDAYADVFEHALPVLQQRGAPATIFVPTGFAEDDAATFWWDECFYLLQTAWQQGQVRSAAPDGDAPAAARLAAIAAAPSLERARAAIVSLVHLLQGYPAAARRALLDPLRESLDVDVETHRERNQVAGWPRIVAAAQDGVDIGSHTRSHCFLDCESESTAREELQRSRRDIERELGRPPEAFAYPGGKITPEVERWVAEAGYDCAVTVARGVNRCDEPAFTLKRISVWNGTTLGPNGAFSRSRLAFNLRGRGF